MYNINNDLSEWTNPNTGEELKDMPIEHPEEVEDKPKLSFEELNERMKSTRESRFPLSVFPSSIQKYIKECEAQNGFDASFTAGYLMSAVSTAAGQNIRLYNGTWETSSQLWMCIVGHQGVSKSHPLTLNYKPIEDINEVNYNAYLEDLDAHKATGEDENKPTFAALTTNDFSNEKLKEMLCYTKKGVAIVKDELIGWLKDMNKYSNSGAIEQYLTYFDGGKVSSDTLGRGSLYAPKSCLNIVGSMQPEVLKQLFKGDNKDNGFLSRILFVYPENQKISRYTGASLDKTLIQDYSNSISWIYGLSDRTLQVSKECRELFIQWEEENIAPLDMGSLECNLMMKLRTYSWRFAIILELLAQAETKQESIEISNESMKGALRLVAYFKAQALKTHSRVHQDAYLNLPAKQLLVYNLLPNSFNKKEANEVLSTVDASMIVLKSLLQNADVIKRISHGQYSKI